jgi:GNAT superfamily N-acetyltransferase
MSATIRFATAGDAPTVHEMIVALAVYEREPDAVEATPESLAEQMSLEPAPFECLLLEDEGEVHAIALFFHNYSTWRGKRGLYLEDLFVLPGSRGRGYGFALLRRLAQLAIDRDCARMEWAVLDWNEPALEFYQRIGAKAVGEWVIHRVCDEPLRSLAGRE